jgi:arsenate reductase
MKLYGIKNCDTVKKARKWLDEQGVDYHFHDFKKDGLSPEKLQEWEQALGWNTLVNQRGTTWRKLPEDVRVNMTAQSAHRVMLDNLSIIKRPVVEWGQAAGQAVTEGFNADEWAANLR